MLHRPGIEPGPPAWQASILPLNQRCFSNSSPRIAWQNSAAHCCFKGQGLKLGPWVEMWRDRRTSKIFQVEEQNNLKKKSSPAGNRTPVSRVTGGDTYHYTTEDLMRKELIFSDLLFLPIIIFGKKKLIRSESKPTLTFYQIRGFEGVTRPIGKKKSPSSRIWTSDLWISALQYLLQSTALPTELSKDDWNEASSKHIL